MWAVKLESTDLQPLAQMYAQGRGLIWLDSSSRTQRFDRYSYLCIDPIDAVSKAGKMDDFRQVLSRYSSKRIQDGPPFQGGLVGFFDYGYGGLHQRRMPPLTTRGCAECHFRLFDTIIAVDHHSDEMWILSSGFSKGESEPCKRLATARINQVRRDIQNSSRPVATQVNLVWRSEISKSDYLKAVKDIFDFIQAGDIYQANFAQAFIADLSTRTDPFQIYLAIRESNPAPFSVYASFGNRSIASTSPERLIALNADGLAEARPIKGTIARSDHPKEDQILRDRLLNSDKDRAENIMIVDLLRNDLSRVCNPHSVQVTELCVLESYAGLHQLTSSVRGQLKDDQDAFDLLSAIFPGGSITGAPKRRAMEIINQLEKSPRHAFCGSFGYFGFDGSADFNIMIRTIQIEGDQARLNVGSGITALSDPDEEYSETLLKAHKILEVTGDTVIE